MAALVVRDGPSAGQRVEVGEETELGRANTEALREDAEASRRHAVVRPGAGGLEIEDLGSSNGTWVNDERLTGSRRLQPGDRVRIGLTTFEVEGPAEGAPVVAGAPGPETRVAPAPAAPSDAAAGPEPAEGTQPQQPVPPSEPRAAQPQAQPAQPAQPEYGGTAPQAAPGGFGGPAQAYGQPAGAYGQPAGAYGQPPATYGRPAGGAGMAVFAGIILLVAALVALAYGALVLVNRTSVFDVLFDLPVPILLFFLFVFAGMVLAIVQLVAGIMAFVRRGRGLAVVITLLALLVWGAELVLLFTEPGAQTLDYLLVGLAVVFNLIGFVLLLVAGRAFTRR